MLTATNLLVPLSHLKPSQEIQYISYLQLLPSMLTNVILFNACLYLSIVYSNTLTAQTVK